MDITEKRYFAAQKALEDAVKIIKQREDRIALLVAEKKQWEQEKIIQTQIISQQIGNSDSVVQQLQNEIIDLKRKHNIKD